MAYQVLLPWRLREREGQRLRERGLTEVMSKSEHMCVFETIYMGGGTTGCQRHTHTHTHCVSTALSWGSNPFSVNTHPCLIICPDCGQEGSGIWDWLLIRAHT